MKQTGQTLFVLFGGQSNEYEISLRSAVFILQNIPSAYRILPVGISRQGLYWSTKKTYSAEDFKGCGVDDLNALCCGETRGVLSSDSALPSTFLPFLYPKDSPQFLGSFRVLNHAAEIAFPVLHGTFGEDGHIQALFDLAHIPYVGCNMMSSAVGMDKDIQKKLAQYAHIPVVPYTSITYEEYVTIERDATHSFWSSFSFPCCVKPNALGSAVGVSKVKNVYDLHVALQKVFELDCKALIENWMQGVEIECSFLGSPSDALITVPGEIQTADFYSYDEKYSASSSAKLFIPARLSLNEVKTVQNLAHKLVQTIGISGFSRIDFWKSNATGEFFFNEYNTIPGMTSISMYPKLLEHQGIHAMTWIEKLIQISLKQHEHTEKTFLFSQK